MQQILNKSQKLNIKRYLLYLSELVCKYTLLFFLLKYVIFPFGKISLTSIGFQDKQPRNCCKLYGASSTDPTCKLTHATNGKEMNSTHTWQHSQLRYCTQNSWNSSNVHHHKWLPLNTELESRRHRCLRNSKRVEKSNCTTNRVQS